MLQQSVRVHARPTTESLRVTTAFPPFDIWGYDIYKLRTGITEEPDEK